MKCRYRSLVASVGLAAALLCGPSQVLAQANVVLGTAANFAVLGGQTVTNTGSTTVTGDLGISPGNSLTGFPPGVVIGTIHLADGVALQAQNDLTTAYNDAAGRPCAPLPYPAGNNMSGVVLGSATAPMLGPGVYCFSTSAQLTGNLTLNGAGVYIFQIGSTLTTAPGSSVTLINGAVACGVWWQVGSSATIDTTTSLAGNILAFSSITMNNGASTNGRVLARNAAVTLNGVTVVSACSGGPNPPVPAPGGPGPGGGIVPTLGPLALALLAIALAAVAFLVLRRNL